jgi:hypothetical protein
MPRETPVGISGPSDQRVEVDPDGERLGGGEHAVHRASVRVAELAGEMVRGERDALAGLTEVDDPVVRDAGVGVLIALDARATSDARRTPPSLRRRASPSRVTATRSGALTVPGRIGGTS